MADNNCKPGIYPGMLFTEYERIQAINNSSLSAFRRSALHAKQCLANPREPSRAMELGTATHAAILEPERFRNDYLPAPRVDKRTRAGKEAWAQLYGTNPDKTVLPADEMEAAKAMSDAVWGCATASALLRAKGQNEVVLVWQDDETGMLCKSRADAIRSHADWTWVLDLKTSRDASRHEFSRSIVKYGYHRQVGMYLDGMNALAGARHRRPVFIVVENSPPFAVACYELEIDAVEQGAREFHESLRMYANCVETGVWPGYPDQLQPIALPRWAAKGEDDHADD